MSENELTKWTVYVDPAVRRRIRVEAAEADLTINEVFTDYLTRGIFEADEDAAEEAAGRTQLKFSLPYDQWCALKALKAHPSGDRSMGELVEQAIGEYIARANHKIIVPNFADAGHHVLDEGAG